jgi:hypothetical protein
MLGLLRSAWPSCLMTCSKCHSMRSPPWWVNPDCGQAATEQGTAAGQGADSPTRGSDFDALLALLHPDIVLRAAYCIHDVR